MPSQAIEILYSNPYCNFIFLYFFCYIVFYSRYFEHSMMIQFVSLFIFPFISVPEFLCTQNSHTWLWWILLKEIHISEQSIIKFLLDSKCQICINEKDSIRFYSSVWFDWSFGGLGTTEAGTGRITLLLFLKRSRMKSLLGWLVWNYVGFFCEWKISSIL